jgi:methionyl-tRNA formyltransferase
MQPDARCYVGNIPGKVERIIPGLGVNVLTSDGVLRIKQVQFDGEKPQNAAEVIRRLKTRFA